MSPIASPLYSRRNFGFQKLLFGSGSGRGGGGGIIFEIVRIFVFTKTGVSSK
jgi:hypothetical protein